MKAPVDRQTMKIFAKMENDKCMLKHINYGKHADKVKEDFLDIYEGTQSELNYVAKFDETTDIGTTYIGKKFIYRKEMFKGEDIHHHMFEMYTLLSETHDNVDLVLSLRNMYKPGRRFNYQRLRFQISPCTISQRESYS